MSNKSEKGADIGFDPKAWGRFERAVDAVVKGGPQHRVKPEATVFETAARLAKECAALPIWAAPPELEQPLKPRTPFS
jgi:hypothetical protein